MSNDWYKQREEFNDFVDLWDKALESGIFPSKKETKEDKTDFFGRIKQHKDSGLNKEDSNYWCDVVSRSGELYPDENTVLMESAKQKAAEKAKKKLGKKTGSDLELVKTSLEKDGDKKLTNSKKAIKLANDPNKILPDTVGNDTTDKTNRVKVTAGLAAHPNLKKLEDLKKKVHKVESDMSDKDGLNDSKIDSLQKQIDKMNDEIEKLSNELHGKYSDSEYYS